MTDLTRMKNYSEKKTISVAAAVVDYTQVSSTAQQNLFNLPDNSLITRAFIINEANGQAGLTVDFGFDGGAELINDAGVDGTPGVVKDAMSVPVKTGTGKAVTAKFSATPTAGRFVFMVEFIEYTLGNGQLMNYTA